MVDMDFLEALGFNHYIGSPQVDDTELRRHRIDRMYNTYVDEDDLRIVDEATCHVARALARVDEVERNEDAAAHGHAGSHRRVRTRRRALISSSCG